MVKFFNILLNGIWRILTMKINIDGINFTIISVIVYTFVLTIFVRYVGGDKK